jgi:hypothetical protein
MARTLELLTDYSDVDLDSIFAHVYPAQRQPEAPSAAPPAATPFQRMSFLFARWTGAAPPAGNAAAREHGSPHGRQYDRLGREEEDAESLLSPEPDGPEEPAAPTLAVTGASGSSLSLSARPADSSTQQQHMSGAAAQQAAMQARRASWNPAGSNARLAGGGSNSHLASGGGGGGGSRRLSHMLQSAEEIFMSKMLAGMRVAAGSRDLREAEHQQQLAAAAAAGDGDAPAAELVASPEAGDSAPGSPRSAGAGGLLGAEDGEDEEEQAGDGARPQ